MQPRSPSQRVQPRSVPAAGAGDQSQLVKELQQQVKEKEEEITAKASEVQELNKKAEAKFMKVKAQAKAKIKSLEEDLEELKKVLFNSNYLMHSTFMYVFGFSL